MTQCDGSAVRSSLTTAESLLTTALDSRRVSALALRNGISPTDEGPGTLAPLHAVRQRRGRHTLFERSLAQILRVGALVPRSRDSE